MSDRPAFGEDEIASRRKLVETAQAIIDGKLPFLEGAVIVNGLETKVGGVVFPDKDFMVFTGIVSETDALPLEAQRKFWNPEALARLEPEIKKKEEWARSIALQACKNLAERFSKSP
jgi:hypothetical protein